MKILFVCGSFGLLRNFESALRMLADRGYAIHLVADNRKDRIGGLEIARSLANDYPLVSYGWGPNPWHNRWYSLGRGLRYAIDYIRYLDDIYAHAPKLRARAESRAPRLLRWLSRRQSRSVMRALLKAVEEALPVAYQADAFIRAGSPDLMMITPLLYLGSAQVDYVRAARRRGVPTVLCVASWDHLTTKGLIHAVPDRVLVWNEYQKAEAMELHGVPAERIVVTGAQSYDHWFGWQPSQTRQNFCAKVGLDPVRPFLLYVCSSPFIAPEETEFVDRWLAAIRSASDRVLRTAGVLVRPHPQNAGQWQDVDLAGWGNVAVWPRGGENPITKRAKGDYYDSIYHSSATVGINTSALIESGIVGRPVFTILDQAFAGTQQGTLHFHYLVNVNGGVLTVAKDLREHAVQVAACLHQDNGGAQDARSFVHAFIRPHGLDVPATPRFVQAVEDATGVTPQRLERPWWAPVLRASLYPVALAWHFILYRFRTRGVPTAPRLSSEKLALPELRGRQTAERTDVQG